MDPQIKTINCACVIHGDAYSWTYVDRLYSMLSRNLTANVKLHVYTEASRAVPDPFIKHELVDWGIGGLKQSWWYKIQLFNSLHYQGPLLYFDLDTVIIQNIDWVAELTPKYLHAIKDFRYLWNPTNNKINSSVMWWDTRNYQFVYDSFIAENLESVRQRFRGDQDYISAVVPIDQRRFLDTNRVKSWRWQCLDGGYDFAKKQHYNPGAGTHFTEESSILVFHGNPKPHEIADTVIQEFWR
jgi:hypothetical protein